MARAHALGDGKRFVQWYQFAPTEKITAIRYGIPAQTLGELSQAMGVSEDTLFDYLGLSRTQVKRLARNHQSLSIADAERVAGMYALIGQVQSMSAPNQIPDDEAAKMTARWISIPMSALGGRTAASYMDTVEGQKFIANLLAMTRAEHTPGSLGLTSPDVFVHIVLSADALIVYPLVSLSGLI